MTVNDIETP